MEDLWNSRRPAKPSYADVFDGPPKSSSAKSSDYAEIFGRGVASSYSIPFLDLAASCDSDDGGGLINYSEIFGGFKAGDFAADYEELFSKKTVESVQTEAKHTQPVGASYLSPEGVTNKENGASSEENKFSSSSNHSDDRSKQFNVSNHWTSRGSMEDVITGKKGITQLHAGPGSTYQINSCSSLQNGRSNNSSGIQANDLINNASCNGQLNDAGQEKIASSISSCDNLRSYVADLKSNGKEFSTNHNASEDGPMHMKHHSRSSSNYSVSSGDIPYPDVSYVSISDISLLTKPSRMPPPSRAPPMLISKQEHTKVKKNSRGDRGKGSLKSAWNQQIHYSIGSAKSHGLQGTAKDSSSGFLDVEVDASSALAASAAAMKEAMKQAQARLKSAKESMDRKRDDLPGRKKVGHKESVKFDERKGVRDFEEEEMFSELTANKLLQKDNNEIKEHTLYDVQKTIKVGKASPYDEWQGNGFKASQICNKSEEITGEWRTEKQFYELINNGKKFGIVKEAFMQEDSEKKPNATSKVSENEVNYSETAELDCEFNVAVKGYKVSEAFERDEINDNSKSYNAIHKEEIVTKAEKIPEICMLKESKSEDSHGCHYQNGKKKSQTSPETLFSSEERNKPNSGKEATCAENEMNVESSNISPEFEEVYHDDKENRDFLAVKEAFGHDDKEKHSSEPYVTFMPYEREKELEGFGGAGVLPENDIKVTTAACVIEAGEIGLEVAYLYKNSENTRGNGNVESYNDENECPLEDAAPINAHEESIMDGSHGACMVAENDFINQDDNEVQKNFEELKPAPDIVEVKGIEEKINSANESCCPYYNSMETRDTHQEYQQNVKKQDVEQPPSAVKHKGEPVVSVDGGSAEKNWKFNEGSEASKNMDNKFDATEATFQRSESKDIEDAEKVSKSDNEDLEDSSQGICQNLSSSHGAKGTFGTAETENFYHDVGKGEELECEKIIEEESDLGKVQARNVEDEKEREREREKYRIDMERTTQEAHERASGERAERIAVERATAESRQRALTEARKKAEKAAAEALEKSLAEKALKEAKLRVERAAVERATAEARERAVEKAITDKAAADARQHAERLNNISRGMGRKESEAGEYSTASDRDNREVKLKTTSSVVLNNQRFQSAGLSGSSQRYADSSAHDEVESPLRCKARLERHQRTVERAAKALAEKNMRDILVQREQVERNRLAESLDADVRRWSTGKEGNLRALLSTLQYILGHESGWRPIPLTEVITAVAVKKAYMKATLYVHPDKLQQRGASVQQKYICDRVFDLLKILGHESGWQPIPLTEVITAVAVKKAYRKATLYVHPDKLQQRGATIQQKYICDQVFDLLKILGHESGWRPIPLTEVITAVAVKKAYRKATLYVHPDKLQQRGATIHQKYICDQVFDLLKEAWNRFNSEER